MPKVQTKVKQVLTKLKTPVQPTKPLWQGPTNEGPMGGVTQSLLNGYLFCPERFRINVIEGLRDPEGFNHRLEYGNMWHLCEESHAAGCPWERVLLKYCQQLAAKYQDQQVEVNKYYKVCLAQFPVYVNHWANHPDVQQRKPMFQEEVFHEAYKLPSGRQVFLRGKFDSVDVIGKRDIYLQENKSKGDINPQELQRNLKFDLQTMLYLIALQLKLKAKAELVRGVRYNVVRRPLAGGKYTIKQKEGRGDAKAGAETEEQFYSRLQGLIAADPEFFFMRWNVDVSPADIERFVAYCFDPMLENLCDDYEWWDFCFVTNTNPFNYLIRLDRFPTHYRRHYTLPFGLWNPIAEARGTPLDDYILVGSKRGLVRTNTMFRELQDVEAAITA